MRETGKEIVTEAFALEGEVVPGGTMRELLDLEARFKRSRRDEALALKEINDRQLFTLTKHKNIIEYCRDRLDLGRSISYGLLDLADVIQSLGESAMAEKITHERQIRDVARMVPWKRKKVIERAVRDAEKQSVPLTGKLVLATAKAVDPTWKSRAEFKKDKSRSKVKTDKASVRSKQRVNLELAFAVVLDLRLTATELQSEFGNLDKLTGGADCLQLLSDWRDSAE